MTTVWIPDAPPTLGGFLTPAPLPAPVLPLLAGLLAVAYLAGAIRMWVRGRGWPVWRTVSFLLGCVALAAVTGLAVENFGYALFSVFMFQQLTLMMLVPALLVLGSPGTLLLRATPHRGWGRIVLRVAFHGLRSRVARWLLHPAFTVPLFLLSFYGLYLMNLADPILALPFGHLGLELGFLVAGMFFTLPILSNDPLPIRMSYPARAIDLTVEVALHAFFGVFLMMSPYLLLDSFASPPPSLGVDPLADQGIAGGLAWSYGEGPNVLMLLYILQRWFRDDTSKAAAADIRASRYGDPDLDAYNEYLAQLHRREEKRPPREAP